MVVNIQSPKFHEVRALDLFTRPNETLTEIVGRGVNIFKSGDFVYSFAKVLSGKPQERIQEILNHGTPRYYCELYPEGHASYTKNYPVGAFHAHEGYPDLIYFYDSHDNHGPLFLVFEKVLLQKDKSQSIYTIKEGHAYSEALQAIIFPAFGKTSREWLDMREKIVELIR